MLEEVKQRLSITGNDLDPTINGMIDDVVAFCLSAGVKYSQLVKPDVIGLIARGVADLWNYGAGDGKFSQVFHMRLNQLCIAAYSIDGDLLPQSKAVTITENGTTEVTPDEGYILTGVTVDTAVPGKPEQAKAVTIRENGVTEVMPDAGHVLTGVTVDTAVPGKPEQTKAVTIRANGVTEVTPDAGHVLTGVTVDTAVPGKPEQTKAVTIRANGVTEVTPDAGHVLTGVTVEAAVPGKPEQVKEVTITENGTTQITPDEGKVLSGVSVSVEVAGGASVVTIPPVSLPLPSDNILSLVTDIDLSSIEWTQTNISDISYLLRRMTNLRTIKWGDLLGRLADSIKTSDMFYDCKNIESIDLTPFNTKKFSDVSNMFNGCSNLKNIVWGDIKFRATRMDAVFFNCQTITSIDTSFLDPEYNGTTNINTMFGQCYALKTIDLSNLKTAAITKANNIVLGCRSLVNIVFEDGCFSNTALKELAFTGSPLSHDCAVDIFNKLAPRTNSPALKLSATTKGYLTENEIAIATGKGWVVS